MKKVIFVWAVCLFVLVPAWVPSDQVARASSSTVSNTSFVDVENTSWKEWPVVPTDISSEMKSLYKEGLAQGNDPNHFSKIGDCQNVPSYFLGKFDVQGEYRLNDDESALLETIDWYSGSWKRFPPSVHGGQNVVAVQMDSPVIKYDNNGQDQCLADESYLDCEVRLWKPSVAIVSFEELWNGDTKKYATYYESLITKLLEHKVVPVLTTTAANEAANEVIAGLALKYHLPVWNLWGALQPLSHNGIVDGFHLTRWGNIFDFTESDKSGWHVRNETALQMIDAVRRGLK